jgi:hypothetical protein
MARKVKVVYDEREKALKKVEEIERLVKEAEDEEKAMVGRAEQQIQAVADGVNMFCGVILSQQDVTAVVDLALKTGESVKIPFKLYFKE